MKKYKFHFLTTLIILVCSSFKILNEPYLFENNEIVIEFPQKPELSTKQMSSDVGELKVDMAFYEPGDADKNTFLYGLISSAYPDSAINSNKTEILSMFFRNSIDGTVRDTKGKLLSEKEISIGKYPGREIRIDYGNGQAIVTMRLYLIKNKMTILQVITPVIMTDSSGKARFFNSLKLK